MADSPSSSEESVRGTHRLLLSLRDNIARSFSESIVGPILLALIVSCIALSIASDSFLTSDNLLNVLTQSSVVGIAAIGATLVIITGGIDLSVGAAIALAGMVAGLLVDQGTSGGMGIMIAILVATAVGAFNGISVSLLRLAPFIVTLAMMGMARGLTLQVSDGETVYGFPPIFTYLGDGEIAGIPVPVFLLAVVFAVGHFVLTRTVFGHQVYAVGGNREAARLAGIPTSRVVFMVYVIAGICAGVAALVLVGRLGAAAPTSGLGLELQVIAAVVIGGTSLFGGRGSLFGTLIGVFLIAVINNGLILLQVSTHLVELMQGALIFVAVLLDAMKNRRKKGT